MSETIKSAKQSLVDDDLLVKAYDDSIKLPREEVARRIALATNNNSNSQEKTDNTCSSSLNGLPEQRPVSYKVGDYVRATYDGDGIDYEGKIILIDDAESMCVLKYIGYENKQEVSLSNLLPSWGKKARRLQFEKAKQDEGGAGAGDKASGSKRNDTVKKSKSQRFQLGAVPPPPPMPPMLVAAQGGGEDSEHLSAMLMSWYMSGYYTGVYQGMKMARDKTKPKKQQK